MPPLDRHAVPRELVVGREAGCAISARSSAARRTRMRALGELAVDRLLLERVEARALAAVSSRLRLRRSSATRERASSSRTIGRAGSSQSNAETPERPAAHPAERRAAARKPTFASSVYWSCATHQRGVQESSGEHAHASSAASRRTMTSGRESRFATCSARVLSAVSPVWRLSVVSQASRVSSRCPRRSCDRVASYDDALRSGKLPEWADMLADSLSKSMCFDSSRFGGG